MPHFGIYSHFPPINSFATSLCWKKVRRTLFWMPSNEWIIFVYFHWSNIFDCFFTSAPRTFFVDAFLHKNLPALFATNWFCTYATNGRRSLQKVWPLQMTAILEKTARCLIIGTKHLILTTLGLYVVWHVGPCIVFVMSRETFAPKIDYHLFVGNSWTAYNCFVWNGTGRNIQLCI